MGVAGAGRAVAPPPGPVRRYMRWFVGDIIVPAPCRFGRMRTEMSWIVSSVPVLVDPL